jgi:hypothetical protein
MMALSSQVVQSTVGVFAEVFQILLCPPVQIGLDYRGKVAHVRDVITEKDRDISPAPQVCVDDGVVQLATPKPSGIPEDTAIGRLRMPFLATRGELSGLGKHVLPSIRRDCG